MITLREGTTFDAAAWGDVTWVAEKSYKDENLEAHEIKPYNDTLSPSRNFTSLGNRLIFGDYKIYNHIHDFLYACN